MGRVRVCLLEFICAQKEACCSFCYCCCGRRRRHSIRHAHLGASTPRRARAGAQKEAPRERAYPQPARRQRQRATEGCTHEDSLDGERSTKDAPGRPRSVANLHWRAPRSGSCQFVRLCSAELQPLSYAISAGARDGGRSAEAVFALKRRRRSLSSASTGPSAGTAHFQSSIRLHDFLRACRCERNRIAANSNRKASRNPGHLFLEVLSDKWPAACLVGQSKFGAREGPPEQGK